MSKKQSDSDLFFGCFGMIVLCMFLFGGCALLMDGESDDYDYDYDNNGKRYGEDYNQDGEYQPADTMTDEEIEDELIDIIESGEG